MNVSAHHRPPRNKQSQVLFDVALSDTRLKRKRRIPGKSDHSLALRASICLTFFLFAAARDSSAQDSNWLTTPYRFTVWYDVAGTHQAREARFARELRVSLVAALNLPAELNVSPVPETVVHEGGRDFLSMEPARLLSVESLESADKLLVVRIWEDVRGFHLSGCELDIRTQQWGPVLREDTLRATRLAVTAAHLLARCHVPVGRIGRVKAAQAEVQLRAGMLTQELDPLQLPVVGSLFRVVVRRHDRLGKLAKNGLQELEWTVLQVTSVSHGRATCDVISGLRNPLRIRGSHQTERLALLIPTPYRKTRLKIVNDPPGLAGPESYEILWRLPQDKSLHSSGLTDWQGGIDLDARDPGLRLYYIKSGRHFLARLPIVTGAAELVTVTLPSDEARLELEGFLQGVQERILDVVAQRSVLDWRIRQQLNEGAVDQAAELYQQLQDLETQDDIARLLRDREQQIVGVDRATRERIDRLFQDTRNVVQQHLATSKVEELGNLIRTARATAQKSGQPQGE